MIEKKMLVLVNGVLLRDEIVRWFYEEVEWNDKWMEEGKWIDDEWMVFFGEDKEELMERMKRMDEEYGGIEGYEEMDGENEDDWIVSEWKEWKEENGIR